VERYIFLLSNGTSFVNVDAILRKLQLFSDGRLEENKSVYSATLRRKIEIKKMSNLMRNEIIYLL
jgi:hypothetical protein